MFFCCCGTCNLCTDNFDRADGTDVTTGSECAWTETTGNWSIASNQLTVGTANALLLSTVSTSLFRVNLTVLRNGTNYRIYFAYVNANNHWYAQFSGTAISIVRRASGVNTTMHSRVVSIATATIDVELCAGIHGIRLILNNNGTFSIMWGGIPPTGLIGLGTGTITGTPTFNDFEALSVEGSCDPCFVPNPCAGCLNFLSFSVDATNLILTNGTCTNCGSLATTWIVDPLPGFPDSCIWRYTQFGFCGGRTLIINLLILDSGGNKYFQLDITLGSDEMFYENSPGDIVANCDGPWTLTLVSDTITPTLCVGTPPATITISKHP